MIQLSVEPRIVQSWKEFREIAPAYSIALDGYVRGQPAFDPSGPHANFNHHEEVDRLSTRSTCAQVYVAIKQGLFETFRKQGAPYAYLYVNQCDQDTALAVWLMQNFERIASVKNEPLISRLVAIEDFIDCTAGMYPLLPSMSIMQEQAWIFEPYIRAKEEARLATMKAGEMETVLEAILTRISQYSLGRCGKIELDTRYEDLGGGPGWKMIKEVGQYGRIALLASGATGAFISVRKKDQETYQYTLGKRSPFIPFPIDQLYVHLDQIEGISHPSADCWGGGNTCGGSPRMSGSRILPQELEKIVNDFIRGQK